MAMFLPKTQLSKEEKALFALMRERVFFIRGRNVFLSTHIAGLYGIEPRVLVQTFKRNRGLFPQCTAFQLNADEFTNLKSQFVISEFNNIRRSAPYAFTEQGLVILGGILQHHSRGEKVNTAVVRAFVKSHRPYLRTRFLA